MKYIITKSLFAAVLLLAMASTQAVMLKSYNIEWEGIDNSTATASAMITMDLDLVNNPGFTSTGGGGVPFVTEFMISVSGTFGGIGDGSWGLADFSDILIFTGVNALDFHSELVGQIATDPDEEWGSCQGGNCGDFNFFTNTSGAPDADFFFQIQAGDDLLRLTSFAPKAAIPEPTTLALMGLGIAGLGFRRKTK